MEKFTLSFDQKKLVEKAAIELIIMAHMKEIIKNDHINTNYANNGHYVSDFIIDLHRFEEINNFNENFILVIRNSGIEFYEKSHMRIKYWLSDGAYGALKVYEIDLKKISELDEYRMPNYQSIYDSTDKEFCCFTEIINYDDILSEEK